MRARRIGGRRSRQIRRCMERRVGAISGKCVTLILRSLLSWQIWYLTVLKRLSRLGRPIIRVRCVKKTGAALWTYSRKATKFPSEISRKNPSNPRQPSSLSTPSTKRSYNSRGISAFKSSSRNTRKALPSKISTSTSVHAVNLISLSLLATTGQTS